MFVSDYLDRHRQFLFPVRLRRYAESFNIPHDLKILQEVFAIKDGNYVRENAFWTSHSIVDMIGDSAAADQDVLSKRVADLRRTYTHLSDIYQQSKGTADIPLP